MGESRRGIAALRDTLIQLEGMALSFAELEARVLPARLRDFSPRLLDELGAMGELVWVGRGALGARDGHVAILRRERADLLLTDAERLGKLPDDASDLHRVIVEHLRIAGASFLVAIAGAADQAIKGLSRDAVKEALWELVWAGIITNDTFAPLRNLRVKASSKIMRKTSPQASFSGRWSLVSSLLRASTPSNPTQRLHALAVCLLDRWGVVSRECALADDIVGGFAALVPVLDTMEEAGTVRRGYFVDGLSGRQYAWAGAVDRLRADAQLSNVTVLPAVDPANPWGAVLPWPTTTGDARPARRGTASVVLVNGAPALHVEPGGGTVLTFSGASDEALTSAFTKGLPNVTGVARRALTIETIDGAAALSSQWAPTLDRAGFRRDYRGFVAVATAMPNSWNAPPAESIDLEE